MLLKWELIQWPNGYCPGDKVMWVQILLNSRTIHLTLTMPLSTKEYKWVLANFQGCLMKCWEKCQGRGRMGGQYTYSLHAAEIEISCGAFSLVSQTADFISPPHIQL